MNWFHKFLNPHCPDCKDDQVNVAIEILKSELAAERYNNQLLINAILPKSEPVLNQVEIPQTIDKKHLPWRVRQQMLEAEDRAKAQVIRQNKEMQKEAAKSTEELETELLGD